MRFTALTLLHDSTCIKTYFTWGKNRFLASLSLWSPFWKKENGHSVFLQKSRQETQNWTFMHFWREILRANSVNFLASWYHRSYPSIERCLHFILDVQELKAGQKVGLGKVNQNLRNPSFRDRLLRRSACCKLQACEW